jgi:hypothetical protein
MLTNLNNKIIYLLELSLIPIIVYLLHIFIIDIFLILRLMVCIITVLIYITINWYLVLTFLKTSSPIIKAIMAEFI